MQSKRNPRIVWHLIWVGSIWLTGCTSPIGQLASPPATGMRPLSGKVAVQIDSSPSSATITVNGLLVGAAPVTIPIEVDIDGDVARDYELTANFADSFGGQPSARNATVSYRIEHGERVPTQIYFDTDRASAR